MAVRKAWEAMAATPEAEWVAVPVPAVAVVAEWAEVPAVAGEWVAAICNFSEKKEGSAINRTLRYSFLRYLLRLRQQFSSRLILMMEKAQIFFWAKGIQEMVSKPQIAFESPRSEAGFHILIKYIEVFKRRQAMVLSGPSDTNLMSFNTKASISVWIQFR
jgi:hypothetical protein